MIEKIWTGFLKCFRGLVAEQKNSDGTWELSLQRVAFWALLAHCLSVWSKFDDAGAKLDVSAGELNTLWALLAYGGVKIGSDMVKSSVSTWKGAEGADEPKVP